MHSRRSEPRTGRYRGVLFALALCVVLVGAAAIAWTVYLHQDSQSREAETAACQSLLDQNRAVPFSRLSDGSGTWGPNGEFSYQIHISDGQNGGKRVVISVDGPGGKHAESETVREPS